MSKTKTLAPPQRNQAIDALRGIACIFVLLVHVTLPGSVGIYVKALARFAVPFFLMNSGWYAWTGSADSEISGVKRQFKKILRLTGIVCLLHIIGNTITALAGGGSAISWIIPHWKWETLKNFLLFNRAKVFSSVVYYFFMLLYAYPVFLLFLAGKKRLGNGVAVCAKVAIPVLLGANLYISEFHSMEWYYAGNWLLTAVPFLFLGYFLREWVQTHRSVSLKVDLALMAAGIVLTFVEIPRGGDNVYLYIGTIITVVPLYHFAVHYSGYVPTFLARFGKAYSSKIFIVHCMVYNLLCAIIGDAAKSEPLQWFVPAIVAAISLLLAMLSNLIPIKNKQ